MDSKYAFAFGFLESAVHRALRELADAHSRLLVDDPSDARRLVSETRNILYGALRNLQFNHGIELHWPDDATMCECGHPDWYHFNRGTTDCAVCGCPEYKERHDPTYDPDDVADQGYHDECYPYSGLGKVRRWSGL